MTKPTHGGRRNPPGGRPPKDGGRITLSVCLSPENAEFIRQMGRDKNDFLNLLLDMERKKQKT